MIFQPDSADEIGKTVCDLVSIKSLSGDESLAADYVQSFLKKAGIAVTRDANDNVIAVVEPHDAGEATVNTLHLSGHTDTVVPVESWESDPWKPQISGLGEDRKIVGLGTSDMKSGLAVMLHAAAHYNSKANRLRKLRLVASFTVCEETPAKGKRNGVHDVLAVQPGRWAITAEASCDPLCPTLAVGCQGHALARVILRGQSAHSASPERGINAIHAAAKICTRVEKMNRAFKDIDVLDDVHARAAAAVTLIKGGSAGNIIPGHCELSISRRVAPGETVKDVERELDHLIKDLDGVEASWKLRCDAPACVTDRRGPLLKCASEASEKLFKHARYSWNRARTDMVLFKQAGMDVLNIGPGFSGQAHVAGEYVRMIDLTRSANLIAETIGGLDRWLAAQKV